MSKQTVVKYKGLELLCKPETVAKYREGKLGLDSCILADIIFKNFLSILYYFVLLIKEDHFGFTPI